MTRFAAFRLQWCARAVLAVALFGLSAWGTLALWYQAGGPAPVRWMSILVWGVLGGLATTATLRASHARAWRTILLLFASAALALLIWWGSLAPSHQRDWADDVARLLEAETDGRHVVLRNVRNFDWRSETDYTPRWEVRAYDLDGLASADLILSYWMGPHIAHTLIAFGFDDGRQVVFSLEIRKQRHESFSAIGGFFRQFEVVLVAADERDIVRTRSNVRGEDVYLYRLNLDRKQLRALFLGYVEEAADLLREPRFYNTLTSNCTTLVFGLARQMSPGLPLDYRLLLSGHLARYVHQLGGLAPGYTSAQLEARGHINARALAADASGEDFSRAIRHGVPGVPPSSRVR